jgi:hypothetical protein
MTKTMMVALAGVAALGFAAPAAAQDMTDDAPFSGLYVGGSFGYDVQPNDNGESIAFDRNLDGVFGDTISTATVANALSVAVAAAATRTASAIRHGSARITSAATSSSAWSASSARTRSATASRRSAPRLPSTR